MLLAIDIGNTNITLGIFKGPALKELSKPSRAARIFTSPAKSQSSLVKSWRINTHPRGTADEYGTKALDLLHYSALERASITAVAIASVVPTLTGVFKDLTEKYFGLKPFVIGETGSISMINLYDNPKEVGADRIVNAAAAFKRFGGPCIVVDFGTAATFDCITKRGEYAGGIIVPGPNLAAESLSLHTAKLPKVSLSKPDRLIGKNTVGSIQSGLYYGYVALVDGLIEKIKKELGLATKIIATGGLASLIAPDSRYIDKDKIFPDLTLEGICLIYEDNLK